MNINLSEYAVRKDNGSLDISATVAKFRTELGDWEATEKADLESVREAVLSVFSKHPGSAIPLPNLAYAVATELGTNAIGSEFKTIGERVRAVVHNDSVTFSMKKGQGGGVTLNTASSAAVA